MITLDLFFMYCRVELGYRLWRYGNAPGRRAAAQYVPAFNGDKSLVAIDGDDFMTLTPKPIIALRQQSSEVLALYN